MPSNIIFKVPLQNYLPRGVSWNQISSMWDEGCQKRGRAPLFDCSGGHVYGGVPKAAIDRPALRRAPEVRPCLRLVDPCACV